jgi:hypothetical protein
VSERLNLETVELIRRTPLRSVLLFLTDRCPVGCGHCSVDSRRDSPMITDFPMFERVLDEICALSTVELVGHLETVEIAGDRNLVDRRYPVQWVIRPRDRFDRVTGERALSCHVRDRILGFRHVAGCADIE